MSWFRQIKVMYSIRILIFIYIIWSLIINILFGRFMDYRIFIISLIAVFFMQFLKSRNKGMSFSMSVPVLACGIIFYFPSGKELKDILLSAIYFAFVTYLLFKMDDEAIDYDNYVYRAQRAVYTLCAAGLLFALNSNTSMKITLGKFMIFYLVMIVVTLRESRQYKLGRRNRHSFMESTAAVLIVCMLSMDKIFNLIKILFLTTMKYITGAASYVLFIILKLIVYLIGGPIEKLIELIKSLLVKKNMINNLLNTNQNNKNNDTLKMIPGRNFSIPQNIQYIIEIFMLILIIYIILRLVRFGSIVKQKEDEKYTIEREKIIRINNKGKTGIYDSLRKFFYGRTVKEEILSIYRQFEKKLSTMGIYKSHMTASQLSNVASASIKDRRNLDKMTHIYNESKFSGHEIKREQLEAMKKSLYEVKKEL